MAVTEIAQLHLLPPTTANDASLKSKLAHAKAVMEKYTGRRFYFLQQIEDPSLLYVIGEWESLDQHVKDFIPSTDNQAVIESLKAEINVDWLIHIDAPHTALPLPKSDSDSTVFSIGRHFIKAGETEKFKEAFQGNKHHLADFVTEGKIGGGWRVDKEEDKEEFVLFCPWTEADQHFGFAKTDGFAKYAQIRDYVDSVEIKHGKLLAV